MLVAEVYKLVFTCLHREKRGMAWMKGLVVGLHLVVLLLGSLPCPAKGADVHLAPASSPPPTKPLAPTYNVSVEGVIYCRCKLSGYLKSMDSSPLPGALVNLTCGKVSVSGKTDSRGYFLLNAKFSSLAEKVMKRYVAKWCKVYVVSTPLPACTVPEYLRPKGQGASVFYERNLPAGSGLSSALLCGLLGARPSQL